MKLGLYTLVLSLVFIFNAHATFVQKEELEKLMIKCHLTDQGQLECVDSERLLPKEATEGVFVDFSIPRLLKERVLCTLKQDVAECWSTPGYQLGFFPKEVFKIKNGTSIYNKRNRTFVIASGRIYPFVAGSQSPQFYPSFSNVKKMEVNYDGVICALTKAKTVTCTTSDQLHLSAFSGLKNVTDIAANSNTFCVIQGQGKVKCAGQKSDVDFIEKRFQAVSGASQIAMSDSQTCVIADKSVLCTGSLDAKDLQGSDKLEAGAFHVCGYQKGQRIGCIGQL